MSALGAIVETGCRNLGLFADRRRSRDGNVNDHQTSEQTGFKLEEMTGPHFGRIALLILLASGPSCASSPASPQEDVTVLFDFSAGAQSWSAMLADYRVDSLENEFVADYRPLPSSVSVSQSAWFLSAKDQETNGLFMFLKRRVDGLAPGRRYAATFAIDFLTDTPSGCSTINGAGAGEGVFVKTGVRASEPQTYTADGYVLVNLAKGNGQPGGAEAATLGNIANGDPCVNASGVGIPRVWRPKHLEGGSVNVVAGSNGDAWLVFGTDSTATSVTRLYYTKFSATFTPQK